MDKLTAIKIKYDDGTYSDEIPVSVLSENVEWDSTHTLVDVLGSIDVDVTGTIQDQISQLFNEKVSNAQLQTYVANQLNTDVTNWLNTNVNPVGSAVVVDSSLKIAGAAADAAITGKFITKIIEDDYPNIYQTQWTIISSGTQWYKQSYNASFIIKVRANDNIFLANSHQTSYYTVLKDIDNLKNYNTPNYATGYNNFNSYSALTNIVIPSDGNYLWIYISSGNSIFLPTIFTINGLNMLLSPRQSLESLNSKVSVLESLPNKVETIDLNVTKIIEDDYPNIYSSHYSITNNKWKHYSYNASYIIAVRPTDVITLNRLNKTGYYCLLKTANNIEEGQIPDYATGYSNIVSYSNKINITVPNDGNYLWIYISSGNSSFLPDDFTINGLNMLLSPRQQLEQLIRKNDQLDTTIDQLDATIDQKKDKYKTGIINNVLSHGNFDTTGSPFQLLHCTAAINSNIMTITGDGSDKEMATSYYYYITNLSINHYYAGVWVKSNNDDCLKITLRIAGGYEDIHITKPVKDKWYYICNKYYGTSSGNTANIFSIRAEYADSTTQNSKSISLKQASAIFTNVDFGLGIDPPLYKLLYIFKNNDYWIGNKKVIIEH